MFMCDLAIVLHKTVEEIEAMSSRELTIWMAYSRIKALPDAHWDSASVAHSIVSVMGGKAKFEDFLPKVERKSAETKVKLDARGTRGLLSRLCGQGGNDVH
jgi:hypothetical protein